MFGKNTKISDVYNHKYHWWFIEPNELSSACICHRAINTKNLTLLLLYKRAPAIEAEINKNFIISTTVK